jgi:GAF domain-containing protein
VAAISPEGQRRAAGVVELLTATCRELVDALDGCGCLVSRIVGDVLIQVAEHSPERRTLALGEGYLISDYPETLLVLESRRPRALSLADENVEPGEARILRRLGFHGLLMLPLECGETPWGLVEVYRSTPMPFSAEDAQRAREIVAEAGRALDDALTAVSRASS